MGVQRVEHLAGDARTLALIRVCLGHRRLLSRGVTLLDLQITLTSALRIKCRWVRQD